MDAVFSFLLVYVVFLGALMSPGPDFLIVVRNALGYSARAGVFTAAGIASALIVHFAYCIAGIGALIAGSEMLFNIVKWIGAGYLLFIGGQLVLSKGVDPESFREKELTKDLKTPQKSDGKAFINGFVTNLFNPKATMFFLALFSQMLDPSMPLIGTIMFCGICLLTAFTWFAFVSFIMAMRPVRLMYAQLSGWMDRLFGLFFIGLGLKLALSKL